MIEQFFKFCVVGGSGVFVDFGVTYLCKEWLKLNNNATIYVLHGRFRLNFYLAKLFAIGVVTFWNFFMNYFFTF